MIAHFINPYGYDLVKVGSARTLLGRKAIYQLRLHPTDPLTYVDRVGLKYQPNQSYETDMGSVPWALRWLCDKDKYLLSFLFHDSAWEHGAVWACSPDVDGPYQPMPMTRKESNVMLAEMVRIEGQQMLGIPATEYGRDSRLIKRAVDLGAWWAKLRGKGPKYPRKKS